MLALHHTSRRKRKHHQRALLDSLVYVAAFCVPIFALPQAYDLWMRHLNHVNVITWGSYCIFAAVWLYYGIIHKAQPIIISNVLCLVIDGVIVVGAFVWR